MVSRLTPRQLECLQLSATLHDQQIADRLGISIHTVRQHIEEAKARLGVQDRKAARRLLPQSEGGQNDGMGSSSEVPIDEAVAEAFQPVQADEVPGERRSVYDVYADLGRWREVPKIAGTRLPVILLVAGISIGIVALLGMLQSAMETIGRLR